MAKQHKFLGVGIPDYVIFGPGLELSPPLHFVTLSLQIWTAFPVWRAGKFNIPFSIPAPKYEIT